MCKYYIALPKFYKIMSAAATTAPAPTGAKRNSNRLQRIFRVPKGNLPARPFHITVTDELVEEARVVVRANVAPVAGAAEAEEGAVVDAEATAVVTKEEKREAQNRLSSLLKAQHIARHNAGIESSVLKKLEQELIESGNLEAALKGETPKTAAEIAAAKRAERFGVAESAVPDAKLSSRAARFEVPVDPAIQAALEKRSQRFGVEAPAAAAPAAIPMTPEMQAALDARARRFA